MPKRQGYGRKTSPPSAIGKLASARAVLYESAMTLRARTKDARPTGFAGETLRALSATLLLLGLIGDRRAH